MASAGRRRLSWLWAAAVVGACLLWPAERRPAGAAGPDGGADGAAEGLPVRTVEADVTPAPGAPQGLPGLAPFPPAGEPFDVAGRRELARDALTFFVRQQGLFPGTDVYQLPAAPWWTGIDAEAAPEPDAGSSAGGGADTTAGTVTRAWDMRIPSSQPIYLLAVAGAAETVDAGATTVTVNGRPLPDLSAYVHGGIPALFEGQLRDFAVLDLVFPPPAAGRYHIEVRTAGSASPATRLVYDLTVAEPDALGRQLLGDAGGGLWATIGGERRRVPDAQVVRLLGFGPGDIVPAAPEVLASLPVGEAIPALRQGMLVHTPGSAKVFRLQDGRRMRVPDAGARVYELDGPVLQTIPPVLQDGMIIQGRSPDVFLVEQGNLRKVGDWAWLMLRGRRPEEAIYVPDQVIATLPQTSPSWVQPGGAWHDSVLYSSTLGRMMPYRVYLPPSYDGPPPAPVFLDNGTSFATIAGAGPQRRYPVLYLLHGMGGRYDEWSGYGVEEVANQLLADGTLPEMIMVLPQGGLGYWVNQDGPGGVPWADYVAHDVVGHVDATYRTIPRRESRAVGGLSMGGHGAIQMALNYPQVFGVAGAHSPSLRARDSAPAFFGADDAAFARRDPVSLVRDSDLETPPVIWIDAGEDDLWRPSAEALHQALAEKGWAHEWQVYPGEHDGWYWGDHLWEYLPFYGNALTGRSAHDPG